jgi:hypothetical protein
MEQFGEDYIVMELEEHFCVSKKWSYNYIFCYMLQPSAKVS